MKEVKQPKKPLVYDYVIVLLLLFLFNLLITRQTVTEIDYGTFMTMTESGSSVSLHLGWQAYYHDIVRGTRCFA